VVERRPIDDILRDVMTAAYDLVRVKVENPRYVDGSAKLDDGVTLFDNARKMMASAARSTVDPRPQFVAGMPNEVTDYLGRVRLGQTERGSYIVNILSPATRYAEELLLFSPERFEREDSFERRVTRTLGRALEATQYAVGQAVQDTELKRFEEAVPVGVSANLCEAIAKIGQSGANTGVHVNLRWALARQPEGEESLNVYFSAIHIPVIEEAGKRLRSTPSREERIEGHVVRLARDRRLEESGVIAIQTILEDRLRRIAVELPPEDYQRAVRAHEEDSPISVYGKLARRGKSFYLQDPRNVEIASNTEEVDPY